MNLYQRIRFLAESDDLDVVVRKEAAIDPALASAARIERPRSSGTVPFLLLTAWRALRARRRYDVVVTDRSAASLVGWAGTRVSRVPWVVDLWDSPAKEVTTFYRDCRGVRCRARRLASQLKLRAFRRVLRGADLVLVSILPRALEHYGLAPERIRTFTNAIDLEPPLAAGAARDARPEELTICIANSLFLPDRGLATLVEAMEILAADGRRPPRVEVVGAVPADQAQLIESSPCRAAFELEGSVSLEEIHAIMASSEIAVIPFLDNADVANTYPVKLFEYMAAGCCVVASDLPGMAAIVEHERNGLLVAPGDARALAGAIARLAADPALRSRLAGQARDDVRAYDWQIKGRAVAASLRSLNGAEAATNTSSGAGHG
jgi:glycosyltransferase involved in cell wall biosynthesis